MDLITSALSVVLTPQLYAPQAHTHTRAVVAPGVEVRRLTPLCDK